jgi:uncharacterized RDD family membrane protein YckC
VFHEPPQHDPTTLAANLLSGLLRFLGYFWMLWDDTQQTWHDKAAGSVVVNVP